MSTVLYLHGFLSSPQSQKARMTQQWLQAKRPDIRFICPQLPSYPEESLGQLRELVAQFDKQRLLLIGSSLGGFWANILVEEALAQGAVLVNPAVSPGKRFRQLVGQRLKHYYLDEEVQLRNSDIDFLNSNEGASPSQTDKYWVMLQTGDETLDYRLAQQKYQHCKLLVEQGGNHSFQGYHQWLPDIIHFLDNQT